MKQEVKEKGILSKMYGTFVQVPCSWYGLCRKYIIPKEVKEFKGKKENSIELNPMEINVLAYLGNYEQCYVTNGTIAEVFNVKKQTIEKYMKELRWVGFIKTFESKDNPVHTDRRDIYVQHDAIKAVLKSENNPYIVPYEYKVHDECEVPYECHASTIQTDGDYLTDVMQVPYECKTNKKELKSIRNNYKTEKKNIVCYEDLSEAAKDNIYSLIMSIGDYKNGFENITVKYNLAPGVAKRIYEEKKKQIA